jgi:hypothetical protein
MQLTATAITTSVTSRFASGAPIAITTGMMPSLLVSPSCFGEGRGSLASSHC